MTRQTRVADKLERLTVMMMTELQECIAILGDIIYLLRDEPEGASLPLNAGAKKNVEMASAVLGERYPVLMRDPPHDDGRVCCVCCGAEGSCNCNSWRAWRPYLD